MMTVSSASIVSYYNIVSIILITSSVNRIMLADRKAATVLSVLALVIVFSGPQLLMAAPAYAQNGTDGNTEIAGDMEINADYVLSYPVATAEITTPVTVGIENHLYYPGDTLTVSGSVWLELVERVDALDIVKIEMRDGSGNVVAREDANVTADGRYETAVQLLDSAGTGAYTVEARVELEADALGIVRTLTSAALQSSIQFAVANQVEHDVNAEGQNFTVWIASNSGVNNFEFRQQEKKVSFFVEGVDGTTGVTEITIPKELLSGQMTILIDQNVAAKEDVLLKSDTQAETTFEINYKHSIHRVEVAGTNVVPEFPVTLLLTAAAIGTITLTTIVLKRRANKYFV